MYILTHPPNPSTSKRKTQVATGTGIAPYRTFVRRLFVEKTPAGKAFKACALRYY